MQFCWKLSFCSKIKVHINYTTYVVTLVGAPEYKRQHNQLLPSEFEQRPEAEVFKVM